ncbi:MAG: BtpA/SgcQ family protein [Bryobacterales bacterium]|nr:BtpA/SgcQ family protein [Bryobacterales bacterium]
MSTLWNAFQAERKPVIGMLHVPALPGSPRNSLNLGAILAWVLQDARTLSEGGVDALIIENFGDVPFYPDRVPAHTLAFLTVIARQVRQNVDLPLGINVLRNDGESAIAIAAAVGAEFVRVNVFTGARLTDQGLIQGAAHQLLRYRQTLGAAVRILADVNVKYSAPLAPRDLVEEVEETIGRGCADGIIVTGAATGKQTPLADLRTAVAAAHGTPVLAGSGVDEHTIAATLAIADGAIVGTACKRGGSTTNPVDTGAVRRIVAAARAGLSS